MAQKGITFTILNSTPIDQTLFGHEFNFSRYEEYRRPHGWSYLRITRKSITEFSELKFLLLALNERTKETVKYQVDAKTYFPDSWYLGDSAFYRDTDALSITVTPQWIARSHIRTNAETSRILRTFYTEDYNLPISMKANFNVPFGSDFRILVEDKTLYVHKFVLIQSAVLTALLQTKMTEAAENSMEISDFDYDTVHEFFGYLYLGKSEGTLLLLSCDSFFLNRA